MKLAIGVILLCLAAAPVFADPSLPAPWKQQDIGAVQTPGSAQEAAGVFTLQGTLDLWGVVDGCQLVWQPCQGDVEIVARVTAMDNPGGVAHAKAGICLRQSLEAGSRHVTMCVTASDGSQFLYRDNPDGKTVRIFPEADAIKTSVPKGHFPCWLKLVRSGQEFRGYESADGQTWRLSGKVNLDLPAGALAGLTASSHKKDILCKATFDNVKLSRIEPSGPPPAAIQRISQLATLGIDGADLRIVYQSPDRIEAPNWSPDGKWLVFNSQGGLWRVAADGSGKPELIPTGDVKGINNDHVLSPDGKTIFFSAKGHLYATPFEGGQPRRISNDQDPRRHFQYYLHGVSPDGKTLAYAATEAAGGDNAGRIDLWTIPSAGGADARLTDAPAPHDGPEYSADGKWIYFNSELNAKEPGHAQCFRMAPDGAGIEQLTHDDRVNWFPHISPDGNWIVYISFPRGTLKHPANKDVILRRMKPDGSEPADLLSFNGGQGTINVNSWSPDSRRVAFVVYPDIKRPVHPPLLRVP